MAYKSRKQHRKSYKKIANTRSRRGGGAGCPCKGKAKKDGCCESCKVRRSQTPTDTPTQTQTPHSQTQPKSK